MRKKYIKPEMEVHEFEFHHRILAGSSEMYIHDNTVPDDENESLL